MYIGKDLYTSFRKDYTSILRPYSIGLVVESNQNPGKCDSVVKVYPIEESPLYKQSYDLEGLIINYILDNGLMSKTIDKNKLMELILKLKEPVERKLDIKVYPIKYGDVEESELVIDSSKDYERTEPIEYTVIEDRVVEAQFLRTETSGTVSPPCLDVGDFVMLYKLGETDIYFWERLFIKNKSTSSGEVEKKLWIHSHGSDCNVEYTNSVSIVNDPSKPSFNLNVFMDGDKPKYNGLFIGYGSLYSYTDHKGNFLTIDADVNAGSCESTFEMYSTCHMSMIADNDILLATKNNEITINAVNKDLIMNSKNNTQITSRNILIKADANITIDAGAALTIKATAINIAGNTVLSGGFFPDTVSPGSCPCCCVCKSGGGSAGSVKSPKKLSVKNPPDSMETPKKSLDETINNTNNLFNGVNTKNTSTIRNLISKLENAIKSIKRSLGI